jgi:hypothetical protein
VEGHVESGDEPVAEVAGGLVVEGCFGDEGANHGGYVVAVVVCLLK